MELFGFPLQFRKWVLACVTCSHFSLNINGSVEVFTRGDLPSVQAVDKCLALFAAYSGLYVNPMKSNLYFGGVSPQEKALILSTTGYVEGELRVRYLGIPLFSARLTQKMFLPMLDKIRCKITHWANNQLSYAGMITLINSVIFGIQNFLVASVLLPKGVVKKIKKLCKDFLWGIGEGQRRMVFKSWGIFFRPMQEGEVNIKEILSWNKRLILDWIRKLELDSSTIWVRWIKAYVLKGVSIWDFKLTAAFSWGWSSIITCRDLLLQFTGNLGVAQSFLRLPDFKQQVYDLFKDQRKALHFLCIKLWLTRSRIPSIP
ncbi:uncharacterized protein LOC141632428 [Silene latifolia]|uniref:uncharacterized protein LOC141632428 n=1 Tax=Silene latifolia TaxID=37657 RepID=UPI003D77CC2B